MNRIKYCSLCILCVLSVTFLLANNISAMTIKKTGYYSTGLSTKKTIWHDDYVKKLVFKKKKIITYGSFYYTKKPIGGGDYLKPKKRTFVISPKCKYVIISNFPENKKYSKRLNKSKAKKLIKQGIKRGNPINYCYLVIKKRKLVRVMMGKGD